MALEHYVTITTGAFMPDLLSDGDVWPCNLVTAKWVVDHGYGFYSDAAGVAATPPWGSTGGDVPAPEFSDGWVNTGTPTEILVDFDSALQVTDETGMTVEVAAAGASIVSATASGDLLTITLTVAVTTGQGVTFAYDGLGNLAASGQGNAAVTAITTESITNEVV